MLSIVFLYFIWKYFSELATTYGKKKWVYGIVGIVSYYAITFIFGVLLYLYFLYDPSFFPDLDETTIGLISIPVGILGVVALYHLFKRYLENRVEFSDESLLDSGYIDDQETNEVV